MLQEETGKQNMTKFFTIKEVEEHSDRSDIWMIIQDKIYDITLFLEDHPGGEEVLLELAGKDASEPFDEIGHSQDAIDLLKKFYVGDLDPKELKTKTVEKAAKKISVPSTAGSSASNFLLALPVLFAAGFAAYNYYVKGTV